MTREQARVALVDLALGLAPDVAGVARLLERISSSEEPEVLRDALTEMGARVLLDQSEDASRAPRGNEGEVGRG